MVALAAALMAVATMTLGVGAQTNDGSDDAGAPQGRIIARVQDRTDDGVDDYRIEFGFFPQWALDDKDPWSEAIDRWSEWLPRARYLTKTVIGERDADDNRRWLRSSLISVPAGPSAPQGGGADADFGGGNIAGANLIEGRVVARYSPDSRGRLRVEFGFLPEWAFTRTANTEGAVEQYGEVLFPRARYLTASMIESRRGVWLRSSVVDVIPTPTGCAINVTVSPVSVTQGEEIENRRIGTVECEITNELNPISVAGTPSGLTVRAVPAGTDLWSLTLSGAATADVDSHSIEITVRPEQGEPVSETVTIDVNEPDSTAVRVNWRGYSLDEIAVLGDTPPRVEDATVVDEEDGRAVRSQPTVTFEVDGAAEEVCDVNRNNGRITPLTAGVCVVIARSAETDQYSAGESDPVQVMITRVSPELHWDGYGEEDLREDGDPTRPREPEARGELSYTYSATPSSICAVNPRTGDLTPHREGDCDVTVRSAETDKFLVDEVTISARSIGDDPPRCNRIPTVGPLEGGETDTINLDSYCRDPEGEDLRYSDAQSDDTATVTVRLVGSSLRVTAAGTPAGNSAQVTFTAADPARNETEARFMVLVEGIQPPEVRSITCRPSSPDVGDRVECTADVGGGEPDEDGWDWRGGEPSGPNDTDTYRATFSEAGEQPVDLTVSNAVGSDSGSITVRVQQSPPQIIRITCLPSSAGKREQVSCEALLRGGEPDEWDWRGGDSNGDREVYNTRFNTSGRKTVSLTVSNSAGRDSDDRVVTVTNRHPERVGSIADVTVDVDGSEPVGVSGNFRDPDGDRLTYVADSDNSAVGASVSGATVTVTGVREGSATITVTADDGDGGTAMQTFDVTVNEIVLPPEISISCPSSADVDDNITCTVSNRGGAIDSHNWSDSDGGSGNSSSYRTSFSSSGTKTVSLTARNIAGGDSDSASVEVGPIIEPTINSISCTPSPVATNTSVTCTVSLSGDGPDSYSWSGGSSSGSNLSYSTSWSSAGAKTVSLTVSNSGGSDSGSTTVTVIEAPEIRSISCSPSSPTVDQSVTCTASLSGGAPDTYSWSSGASAGSESTYSTSFGTSGSKTVSLAVSNSAGSDSDSTTVTVSTSRPLIESISCSPLRPSVGEAATCAATLRGGTPTSWAWRGGYNGGDQETYDTTFSSSGSKSVRLTVTNSAGSDSYAINVSVRPPPPPQCDEVSDIDVTRRGSTQSVSVNCTGSRSLRAQSDDTRIATVSVSGHQVTVEGERRGSATITVTATGRGGSTTVEFDVTVGNTSPTCKFPKSEAPTLDDSGDGGLVVDCSDPDGDRLRLTAESSDTGVVFISTTGSGSLWIRTDDHGSATVTYTVTDGHGGTFRGSLSVTVRDCISRYAGSGKCARYAD